MLELILTGLLVLGIIQVIKIAILGIEKIVGWFRQQQTEGVDVKAVGFTLREALEKGSYSVVQGIFNRATDEVTAARRITGKQVDDTLTTLHESDKVVFYE